MSSSSKKTKGNGKHRHGNGNGVPLGFEHPRANALEDQMVRISFDLGCLLKEVNEFEEKDGTCIADFVERLLDLEQRLISTADRSGAKRFIFEGIAGVRSPAINIVAVASVNTEYMQNHWEERWISFVIFLHDMELMLIQKFCPEETDRKARRGYLMPGEFPEELAQLGLSSFGDIKSIFPGVVVQDGHIVPSVTDEEIDKIIKSVLGRSPLPHDEVH